MAEPTPETLQAIEALKDRLRPASDEAIASMRRTRETRIQEYLRLLAKGAEKRQEETD